jgi:hypothetical protein
MSDFFPEAEKAMKMICERKQAHEKRTLQFECFRNDFHQMSRSIVRPAFQHFRDLLAKQEGFDTKIQAIEPKLPFAADAPFLSLTLFIWPPKRPGGEGDASTMQVQVVGNFVTGLVEINHVPDALYWADKNVVEGEKVAITSMAAGLLDKAFGQVMGTLQDP